MQEFKFEFFELHSLSMIMGKSIQFFLPLLHAEAVFLPLLQSKLFLIIIDIYI